MVSKKHYAWKIAVGNNLERIVLYIVLFKSTTLCIANVVTKCTKYNVELIMRYKMG